MKRALMQQYVVERSYSTRQKRSAAPIGSGGFRRHTVRVARRSENRKLRFLKLPKTLSLIVVAAGLAYALVAHVPELATVVRSESQAESFEAASMPDFANVLASIPQREVVFDMTDDLEYLVQKGETLSEIATRNSLSTELLAEYNGLSNADLLIEGQVIVVPGRRNRD
jgi:hypothetical protein